MAAKNLKVGDLVWAKMKGFPSWPARIIEPPITEISRKPKKGHYVYFFGSDNYAWIMDDKIVLHTNSMLENGGKKRSAALQKAIEALLNYNRNNAKKEKSSAHKVDQTNSQVEKDFPESKSPQLVNDDAKKSIGKKVQPPKKVKENKSAHKVDQTNSQAEKDFPESKSPQLVDDAKKSIGKKVQPPKKVKENKSAHKVDQTNSQVKKDFPESKSPQRVNDDAEKIIGKKVQPPKKVKENKSAHKVDQTNSQVKKDFPESKSPQLVNDDAKKSIGKKVQPPKKVKENKVQKKTPEKRPSIPESDDDSDSSVFFKRSRPSTSTSTTCTSDEYSASDVDTWLSFSSSGSSRSSSPYDIERCKESVKPKIGRPTSKRIGFLGLGLMGQGIVMNLLKSGHRVTVWNRSLGIVESFLEVGAETCMTPAEVVAVSDIIFCCVSDPEAAKSVVFGNDGVLHGLECCDVGGKGYVEMTSVDPDTSCDIAEAIISNRGKYLEAPVIGSKREAEEGTLFILASGSRSLFKDCETCFRAISNHVYYISQDFPSSSKMNLILTMFLGTTYVALSEALALVEKARLSQEDFMEILSVGTLNCQTVLDKGHAIVARDFSPNTPLKHMQKDLNLAMSMGHFLGQPMPLAAAANEAYKHAKLLRFSDHDVCAVYLGAKY
ncbi:putative oxidoreductase GLYR1 homolog [Stegodyphus dumicola]|uniref:putative oxidoreductase GLYR1 homolog n=1 Tax=Stegodyphus dumicola TaxID=202533 RepID=UPI0015AA8F4B|nr:putative oxidoreductase GLYR1 homolog [Stegodyphus dumicola]